VRAGSRCALAPAAHATHEHSATLGSGSREKDYLTGFGRGYVLRKWSVLESPRRAARVLIEDGVICGGQLLFDRTPAGIRGRLDGFGAAAKVPRQPYPEGLLDGRPAPSSSLARRLRRRSRLGQRGDS
jgi:hypothetical protein